MGGIGRSKRMGDRSEAIYVEADSQRLSRYGVSLPAVNAVLMLQNAMPFTGSIKSGDVEVPLHTVGRFTSTEDVRQQVVSSDPVHNRVVRIGDVAKYPDRRDREKLAAKARRDMNWDRFQRLLKRYGLPPPRIVHSYVK